MSEALVADSLTLMDMFARGVAVGIVAVLGVVLHISGPKGQARWVSGLTCVSVICWLVRESAPLWLALGSPGFVTMPALAAAGMFWLFVVTLFDDRPIQLRDWLAPAVLFFSGPIWLVLPVAGQDVLWSLRNLFSGVLALHAGVVVVRGWRGDLLETRRRLRAPVLGLLALFAVLNVVIALATGNDSPSPWAAWNIGHLYGVTVFGAILLVGSTVFLQARASALGPPLQVVSILADLDAAGSHELGRLNALMASGLWRREGLTIGAVARELEVPEHRLRRLINQRLGHRNFADFVNGFRIDAAKARLGDPSQARTTVATIAFDLGYGSLGPFNRAFRAATGRTPTEWRRLALQSSPDLNETG